MIGREMIGWKRQLSAAVRREYSDLANMIMVAVVINGSVDQNGSNGVDVVALPVQACSSLRSGQGR